MVAEVKPCSCEHVGMDRVCWMGREVVEMKGMANFWRGRASLL